MIKIHAAYQRGTFRNDWLEAFFSFEFGTYRNAYRRCYSDLIVLNEDFVAPGGGFGMHPHDNVEVMSYPLEGAIEHRDHIGSCETISYGDVHLMRAGSGIVHSEMNASREAPERHVQWWIRPAHRDTTPGYAVRHFAPETKVDRLCLIASADGSEGSLEIDQDIRIYASIVGPRKVTYRLDDGRRAYIHVLKGTLDVNGERLSTGDGAHAEQLSLLSLISGSSAEVLLFDLR
ncbi:pirin family protein [Burkholderia cenocepacia]|nr:pirin family protein [Burkholderia cenocepacia]